MPQEIHGPDMRKINRIGTLLDVTIRRVAKLEDLCELLRGDLTGERVDASFLGAQIKKLTRGSNAKGKTQKG